MGSVFTPTAVALDRAPPMMRVAARRALRETIHAGARIMIAEPRRIPRALLKPEEPFDARSLGAWVAQAEWRCEAEAGLLQTHHGDMNRLIAAQQARLACWWLLIARHRAAIRQGEAA